MTLTKSKSTMSLASTVRWDASRRPFVNALRRTKTLASDVGDRMRHKSTSGSARKAMQDETVKIEEKRQAFEHKHKDRYMEKVTKGDERRLYVDSLMEHGLYQAVMTVCTGLTMLLVALEADYHAAGDARPKALTAIDGVLIAIFSVDIFSKVYVYQFSFPLHLLNVFEAVLLVVDVVLQLWHDLPRITGAFKVLRFIRMMRILRSLSALRDLYLMMMGLAASLRAIIFGAGLLALSTTVFSILAVYFVAPICHELDDDGVFENCTDCRAAFDSVSGGNLMFFKTILAGDSWGQLAVPLIRTSNAASIILVGAWAVLALGLMNTIAAVIVDRQAQARVQDEVYQRKEHALK
eukprot:TRINITY_DN111052_c0_g1_i1.p1 TRINITY_DN111052_c0_g1~~TRINITY_DN111052_c0_g1_i1.p1  ORF type:complete len:351 (-),score=33.87 TRINITY_DN111052_c0_g1_i1:534-1586(-)